MGNVYEKFPKCHCVFYVNAAYSDTSTFPSFTTDVKVSPSSWLVMHGVSDKEKNSD